MKLIDPNMLTWRCEICHQERPDCFISVHKVDITPASMQAGTVMRNVKYCNDNDTCFKGAANHPTGWRPS